MATRIWRGDAVAVAQVITRTIGGTWLAGEKITITLNGKDVVATVGNNVAVTDIATLISEAWNGTTLTDTTASVTPSDGGGSIAEFMEVTASTSSAAVLLTADTAGTPFDNPTITTDSVSGTLGSWSTTTASAGPNHWDTAENWEGDTVPVNTDDVVIPAGSVDILYGLDQSAVTLTSLEIEQGYTGKIGLPEVTTSGYDEYRDTYLKISATTVNIGTGTGQGSQRIKLNVGANACTLNVSNSGTPVDTASRSILFLGTNAANVVNINKGSLGIASQPGEVATVATLRVGYQDNVQADADVVCGSGVTLTNIDQSGGKLTIESGTTSIDQTNGTLIILDGAHTAITSDGGTCDYRSNGTVTTAIIGNEATLDLTKDMRSRTITNASIYAGGTIRDSFKTATWTNGIDLVRTSLDKVTLDIGSNFTLSQSVI